MGSMLLSLLSLLLTLMGLLLLLLSLLLLSSLLLLLLLLLLSLSSLLLLLLLLREPRLQMSRCDFVSGGRPPGTEPVPMPTGVPCAQAHPLRCLPSLQMSRCNHMSGGRPPGARPVPNAHSCTTWQISLNALSIVNSIFKVQVRL